MTANGMRGLSTGFERSTFFFVLRLELFIDSTGAARPGS